MPEPIYTNGSHKTIDDLLMLARGKLPKRYTPQEAFDEIQSGALLVDLRYLEQILSDGEIPGALGLHTNEVFWRLHPECPYKDEHIHQGDYEQRILILCNQGYSSSLFAAVLRSYFDMPNVTDVIGGFEAWQKAGLPVIKPKG